VLSGWVDRTRIDGYKASPRRINGARNHQDLATTYHQTVGDRGDRIVMED
jgi:hypothetical protein